MPFDLAGCADRLSRGFGGLVYGRYFLRSLKSKVHDKRQLLESELDVERVLRARTVVEYDDALTAPLHGFRDAQDYYERADARHFGTDAQSWMNLQDRYELAVARRRAGEALLAIRPREVA